MKTNEVVEKKIPLDQAVIDALQRPLYNTWNAIGWDIEEAAATMEEEVTNYAAIESCIDADHMTMYGAGTGGESFGTPGPGKDATDFVRKLFKQHGYDKVMKFLCKHICIA